MLNSYTGKVLLILVMSSVSTMLRAQNYNIYFERIGIEQGLSQSSVQAIVQDMDGYLWFGTQDGLNQFDGYEFTVYKHHADDSTSLSDDWITALCLDPAGDLWVGTAGGGLNKYQKDTGSFIRYTHRKYSRNQFEHKSILDLFCTPDGTILIGTDGGGLYKYDKIQDSFDRIDLLDAKDKPISERITCIFEDHNKNLWLGTNGDGLINIHKKGKFTTIYSASDNRNSLSSDHVLAIFEDSDNFIWIGTDRGLNRFDPEQKSVVRFTHDPGDLYSISNDVVYDIFEDQNKVLWIATDGGLNLLNRQNGKFWINKHETNNTKSLSNDLVRCIYGEKSGTVWVGTYGGGLNQYNWRKRRFNHYRNIAGDPNSLHDNTVWTLVEDENRNLWVGTNKGIALLDRKNHRITRFLHDPQKQESIGDDIVRVVFRDKSGQIWCGTNSGGLNRYIRKSGKFEHFVNDPDNKTSISSNTVRAIYEDHAGSLWIGTWNGLNKFDRRNKIFLSYQSDDQNPYSISDNRVRCLAEDRDGTLWVGTYGGLNKFDAKSGKFEHFISNPQDSNTLSHDRVLTLYIDDSGILWIGTYGGGLNRFDPTSNTFTHFTEEDGLSNNAIYGILADDLGHLWLSTNRGLSRFNIAGETFKNYDINDGLQSNEFNGGAFYKNADGEMFFGGINGFNSFFPEDIKENDYISPIVFTSFQIFDREIDLGQNLNRIKTIELSYKQNFFSFEFAALDFTNPVKNKYAYYLEGFDQDWIRAGNRRFANYTNIDGGEYVFHVKGSNSDGIWNEAGISLRIKVVPPFWQTLWFRLLSGLLVAGAVYVTYRSRVTKVERQKRKLQKEIKQRTREIQDRNYELIQAKRQTDNILKNVADGLFLLKKDFSIESQYSAALEDILAEKDLSKKSLLNIIENRVIPTVFNNAKEYLELMFEQDVDEVTINDLNPLTRIEYQLSNNGSPEADTRFLSFRVRRVIEANRIRHLIIAVSDITDQTKLASELEESEVRTRKQMEWLVSILHIEAPLLRDFIQSVEVELETIEKILRDESILDYQDVLTRVNRSVISIKSNASLLDLKYFVNAADEFNHRIKSIGQKERIEGTDFVPLILKLGEMKRNLKDINNLIDKISQIRTYFRPKREYENQILINSLQNLVQNLSNDLNKEIFFKFEQFAGEDIPYKYRVLVKDLLVELVRNAIQHGIEPSEQRIANNKPPTGIVEIRSERTEEFFRIFVSDDGRGLQEAKLKSKAKDLGFFTRDGDKNSDISNLILKHHISTCDQENPAIEGGIGLSSVKRIVEEHDGTIQLESSPDQYCHLNIKLPVEFN